MKDLIKNILGIYEFDRKAEEEIKKSITIYHKGGRFYKYLAIRRYNKIRQKYNCDIWPGIDFGSNNYIAHPNNILIGKTSEIGNNVKIYPNSQLIAAIKDDEKYYEKCARRHPKVLNNVIIGAGSTIIGAITIGNNVIIGAGSIVTKDVPDNTTVVGINRFINSDSNKQNDKFNK